MCEWELEVLVNGATKITKRRVSMHFFLGVFDIEHDYVKTFGFAGYQIHKKLNSIQVKRVLFINCQFCAVSLTKGLPTN